VAGNGLDACERAGTAPSIHVVVNSADAVCIQDNGPGLPESTLRRSLDYAVRVSDKRFYVSPTRGMLGNFFKCLWAAPHVAGGGWVEVAARGKQFVVSATIDPISQTPQLEIREEATLVNPGTFFKVHWPQIASCLTSAEIVGKYKAAWEEDVEDDEGGSLAGVRQLLMAFALFNPHASFHLTLGGETIDFERLEALSVTYQEERGDLETNDPTRVAIKALQTMLKSHRVRDFKFAPKDLAKAMNRVAVEEDLADEDKPFTNSRRVGWLLKRLRFRKCPRAEKTCVWETTEAEVEALAHTYGMESPAAEADTTAEPENAEVF
jgi:hypothetical protein